MKVTFDKITMQADTNKAIYSAARCKSLDAAYKSLKRNLPAFNFWFIYRGGHHIALHSKCGAPRMAMISE